MDHLSFEDLNHMDLPGLDRVDVLDHLRIIRLKDAIDRNTIGNLLKIQAKLAQTQNINTSNILFDFKKVTRIDQSTAIQLLSRMIELQEQHKHIGIINAPEALPDMIMCDEMDTAQPIQIFDSEEDAVTHLNNE